MTCLEDVFTHEWLIDHYEYIDGWLVNRETGRPIGCLGGRHITLWLKNRQFKAHRVIWFYHYKVWPKEQIDHKDRNSYNNRIENLRECTNAQNQINIIKRQDCGIYPFGGKFKVIVGDGATGYIGLYNTIEEARKIRDDVKEAVYGEFYSGVKHA